MIIARERFANAADFTFIITGAVDEATLLPLVERYIASLPATKGREKANVKIASFKKKNHENVFRRQMDVPMVTNVFFDHAMMKYTLKNKLAFSLALNALSVELLEEIREKEGGTYGIGAYGELMNYPISVQQAFMQIPYQASPDRYEYLNQRVRDIVTKFVTEGPSEENLTKGKEYFLKNHREDLRENSYWASAMSTLLDTKTDLTRDYESVLQSITREDTRRIIQQLMKQQNHSEVIMVGVEREK
jgi:zinc protease